MLNTLRHLFTPHHTNNHRPRILHPAGLAVLIAVSLVFHSSVQLLTVVPPKGMVLGFASNIAQEQVIQLTNQERSGAGLPELKINPLLNQAAAAKAQNMFEVDYWAHISPTGVTPWFFIKEVGYRYSVAGENLARDFDNTPEMVAAWMASPTHKANIVHKRYTETGVAVVNGKLDGIETTLVVQMFGNPVAPALVENSLPTPAPQITTEAVAEIAKTQDLALDQAAQGTLAQRPSSVSGVTNSIQTFVSPLDIKKSLVISMIGLILGVLVLDEIIIRHKKTLRFVGKNIAHISFLTLILFMALNVIQAGGIL